MDVDTCTIWLGLVQDKYHLSWKEDTSATKPLLWHHLLLLFNVKCARIHPSLASYHFLPRPPALLCRLCVHLAAEDAGVSECIFADVEFRSVVSLIQKTHLVSCLAPTLIIPRLEEPGEVPHSFLKVSFNSVGFGWLPVYKLQEIQGALPISSVLSPFYVKKLYFPLLYLLIKGHNYVYSSPYSGIWPMCTEVF